MHASCIVAMNDIVRTRGRTTPRHAHAQARQAHHIHRSHESPPARRHFQHRRLAGDKNDQTTYRTGAVSQSTNEGQGSNQSINDGQPDRQTETMTNMTHLTDGRTDAFDAFDWLRYVCRQGGRRTDGRTDGRQIERGRIDRR